MDFGCNIKQFILKKTKECIEKMPQDVYAIHYFINTNEGFAAVPTLALMYNTLSEIDETGIEPIETCWNIACWYLDEFPIIGDNIQDTDEAEKTMRMLSQWFADNGYDSSKIEKDPIDDYEYTVGYRVLSEMIEAIAPDVKIAAKETFGRDVVLLLGEYSYMPCDMKKIRAMNGEEALPFFAFCEEERSNTSMDPSVLLEDSGDDDDEEFSKIVLGFLEKLKEDSKSE